MSLTHQNNTTDASTLDSKAHFLASLDRARSKRAEKEARERQRERDAEQTRRFLCDELEAVLGPLGFKVVDVGNRIIVMPPGENAPGRFIRVDGRQCEYRALDREIHSDTERHHVMRRSSDPAFAVADTLTWAAELLEQQEAQEEPTF